MFEEELEPLDAGDLDIRTKSVEAIELLTSPIQEHHIDFLLEEEFACNSAFLNFFLSTAKTRSTWSNNDEDKSHLLHAHCDWNCKAIRSVTTDKGETDVLAIYVSALSQQRVAILIEDKIRAGFQPDQANRYRQRGEEGKVDNKWKNFWTCIVCPQKYATDNRGFDARVTLEDVSGFFSGQEDERSRFKHGVVQRAVASFAITGLKIKDTPVTAFRSFYAEQAALFFSNEEIIWDRPRDAWSGDTWFTFKGGQLPKGVLIVHKAAMGVVDMAFSNMSVNVLQSPAVIAIEDPKMTTIQTGKSASFRISVAKITDFLDFQGSQSTLADAFASVRQLLKFYEVNGKIIRAALERDSQR